MNKNLPRILFLGFFSFFLSTAGLAQLSFGVHYNISKPLQEYAANLHKNPQGISVSFLHKSPKRGNLLLGGELGVSMYANEKYSIELTEGDLAGQSMPIYEEDCYFRYNALARYVLVENRGLRPYLEAHLGGVSYFSTRLADDEFVDYFENVTKFHGTALNLGLGLGVLIKINSCLGIDLAMSANRGSKALYRSVVQADTNNLRLSLNDGSYTSATHHLNFRLGTKFGF